MKQLKMLVTLATLVSVVGIASIASAATGATTSATGSATATSAVATESPDGLVSLNVTEAPRLVKKDASSVTLEWTKVVDASGEITYMVKYATGSVARSEVDDYTNTLVASSTGATISNLTANSTYYFSVIALNKAGKQSANYSDELQVSLKDGAVAGTGSVAPTTSLALTKVTPVNAKEVTVEFSDKLATAPTFKIEKTGNKAIVTIANVTLDAMNAKIAHVTLATALDPSSSYNITALTAKDVAGNSITDAIKAMREFPTTATLAAAVETSLNAAGTGVTSSGTTASGSLADSKALPATGTKENVIVALALALSLGIVLAYRRKKA